jgi:hypothetical protein
MIWKINKSIAEVYNPILLSESLNYGRAVKFWIFNLPTLLKKEG